MSDHSKTSPEGLEILYALNFDPEFIGHARGNLFLLSLEAKEKFDLKVGGKKISLNLPHFRGADLNGNSDHVYIPLRYIPALHVIPQALAGIGGNDPLHQQTILRQVIQEMDPNQRSRLQDFLKAFDTHPAIKLAEQFAAMFAEMFGAEPPRPYRGNDHVARSKLYNDVVAIDGEIYAEFFGLYLEPALAVLVGAGQKIAALEGERKGIKSLLKSSFSEVEKPQDYDFWKDMFTRKDNEQDYTIQRRYLLPDHDELTADEIFGNDHRPEKK